MKQKKIFCDPFFSEKIDFRSIENRQFWTKNSSKFYQFFHQNSSQFWGIYRIFFMPGYDDFPVRIMKFIEKIDRVTPRDFDQFWIILQIIEPNEDLWFFAILEKTRFVSSRVWHIIVLNYDFFFKKNWYFWNLNHTSRFYKRMPCQICHTLDELNQNLHFLWLNFLSKKFNFQLINFPFFFVSIIFFLLVKQIYRYNTAFDFVFYEHKIIFWGNCIELILIKNAHKSSFIFRKIKKNSFATDPLKI